MAEHKRYHFDGFVLDTATKRLSHMAENESEEDCTPRAQAFELIEHLIRNRPGPVSKKELYVAIWKDSRPREVGPNIPAVDQALMDARRALCDNPEIPRYIARPQPGYLRFVPEVTEEPVAALSHSSSGADSQPQPDDKPDPEMAEKTGFSYSNAAASRINSRAVIKHLTERYKCKALHLVGNAVPVTILWENGRKRLHPDKILGHLNRTEPRYVKRSAILADTEAYKRARGFIRTEYTKGPVQTEDREYKMTKFDLRTKPPKVKGALGFYYDGILGQYGMEWELRKALSEGKTVEELKKPGSLPLREAAEKSAADPLRDGVGRCNNIGVSTLMVFKRRFGYYTILSRRSEGTRLSSNMLHVVPSGAFAQDNGADPWSVEDNVWRELIEELYDDENQKGSGMQVARDHIRGSEPVKTLLGMIEKDSAEFSVTGVCCDLLTLRPEICTVLFISGLEFAECSRKMELNWEYEMQPWSRLVAGEGMIRWEDVDTLVKKSIAEGGGVVPNGAACFALGRRWLKHFHPELNYGLKKRHSRGFAKK